MNPSSLATRVTRGILWTGSPFLIHIVTQLLFFGSLGPEVTGPFFVALTVVMVAALIGDLGLGTALVQNREAGEEHFSSAFWVNLSWGIVLTMLVATATPPAVRLLGNAGSALIHELTGWLCLIIPFASVSGLFRARLQRELRFAAMSRAEIASVVVFSAIALSLLPRFGIWALVAGSVAREIALLVVLWIYAAWRPRLLFSTAALSQIFSFALNFTGERIVGFMNSRLGQLLIASLGQLATGHYAFVTQCTITPLVRISTILHRVSMPAFSSIQDEEEKFAVGYIKAIQGVALVLWPVAVGLFLFAPEIINAVNSDYASAANALRLLALAFILKSVGSIVGAIFLAKGKATWSFRWALASLAILVPALVIGLRYGIDGVAAAILGTSVLNFVVTQIMVHRLTRFSLPSFAIGLGRPLLVCLVVGLALLLSQPLFVTTMPDLNALRPLRELFADRVDAIVVLVQAGVCGLLAYAIALRLFAAEQCGEYWRSLRGGPGGGGQGPISESTDAD